MVIPVSPQGTFDYSCIALTPYECKPHKPRQEQVSYIAIDQFRQINFEWKNNRWKVKSVVWKVQHVQFFGVQTFLRSFTIKFFSRLSHHENISLFWDRCFQNSLLKGASCGVGQRLGRWLKEQNLGQNYRLLQHPDVARDTASWFESVREVHLSCWFQVPWGWNQTLPPLVLLHFFQFKNET